MKRFLFITFGLICSMQYILAQSSEDIPFNGLITDPAGKGIKARVSVKNSPRYTMANGKGQFGLTNIGPTDTLVFTYKKKQIVIPVGQMQSMKVLWVEDTPVYNEDEDLVDTGFSYIKRREYTSGSSGLTGEDMIRKGFTDIQTAILAMVPGVQMINGELVIRGAGSLNSGNAPLIIFDNVPVQSLSGINIYDVATVEVQKGSNMYGLRGGNGVIIVRSKRGGK
ncbi:TonB-dependent receptor plug domain-containing protein [uncultured Alistipes sp.]|uniref:TonB-dependent receptor plug domain-containing protein n=1 Tax=uncultured Alistipes sp. TaxID=538949 RepID=UPI0025CC9060|nr:TonB-dependent receptor plug domain-containing protein [uncultured Alistipes sp.]